MAFTTWSNKAAYYQVQKKSDCGCSGSENHSGCGNKDCGGDCDECKRGCKCPTGTVEVKDPSTGCVVGCLTPNDAEGYFLRIAQPPAGLIRWVQDGVFMGFVTPSQYLELNPS